MTRGRRNAAKSGKVLLHGARAPYGYILKDDRLVICEEEARIIRLIFRWYTEGEDGKPLNGMAIAARLSRLGVPTRADTTKTPFKKLKGVGEWSPTSVSKVLKNRTYIGEWRYSDIPVSIPSIVSDEVFELAQERKAYNRDMASRHTKNLYLLRRRAICGHCGAKMTGKTLTNGNGYAYYRCACKTRVGARECDNPYFKVDHVDAAVWEWVKSLLMNPEALRQDLEAQQAEQEEANKPLRDQLAIVDDLLSQRRAECERCFQAYVSGRWDEDVALREKAQLDKIIDDLEGRWTDLLVLIEGQIISDAQIATITGFAQEVREGLTAADEDFEARRQIIDLLDVGATLAKKTGRRWPMCDVW